MGVPFSAPSADPRASALNRAGARKPMGQRDGADRLAPETDPAYVRASDTGCDDG